MSRYHPSAPVTPRRRPPRLRYVLVGILAVAALTAAAAILSERSRSPEPAAGRASRTEPKAVGTASAGGIQVDGARIGLGRVPLDTTVVPKWTLTNTTGGPVEIGAPHVETVEGCCPSEPQLDDQTLAPGETTTLSFPLQMHAGMDGPHHFKLHVPAGGETMALEVTGDFTNG